MKKTRKWIKLLVPMMILINCISLFCTGSVQAVFSIKEADLYSKGDAGDLLKYNDELLYSTMVFYKKDGVEYPAYCIQSYLPGVMENGNYTVSIENVISDTMVWRAIINGYPYKTPKELGCDSVAEAFTATKQAVYCMLYGNDANNFAGYEAVGEAGQRTLNALKKIVTTARNSTEVPGSSQITIQEKTNMFAVDTIDKNFISKEYALSSAATNGNYTVSLEGDYPKGTLVTDVNNKIKNQFAQGENLKILIPINTTQKGSFTLKVTGELKTKPVLYGKAPYSNWQDYALAAGFYELGEGTKTITTPDNSTTVEIQKWEGEKKEPMAGVIFQVLDENQKVVQSNLTTDETGSVEVEGLVPGTYYLQEVSTQEGYEPLEGLREFTVEYNQDLTIEVSNFPKEETIIIGNNANMSMGDSSESIIISNKNSNTNVMHHKEDIKIENQNTSSKENSTNTNINVQNQEENKNNENQNTNINNTNQNNNSNNSNQNTNLNNANQNTNLNTANQNTNGNNSNQNANTNNNNQNANTNNNNQNINGNNSNQNVNGSNSNQNTNVNTSNQNSNINNVNQNVNANNSNQNVNVSSNYHPVKLPKTGM